MFKSIGRRLLGALSVTGRFKTHEAQVINDGLADVERQLRDAPPRVEQAQSEPNRAEKSAARRRNRFRTTRNKAFHAKRNNSPTADGLTFAQPSLTHERVNSRVVHWMYNPLLHKLLWSSKAMDAKLGISKLTDEYPIFQGAHDAHV